MANEEFADWIYHEIMRRGWNQAELARRAGLAAPTVSLVLSGQKNPGLEFCQGIAQALNLPGEEVLRRAGLLPQVPEADRDKIALDAMWYKMDERAQKQLLAQMRGILEFMSREETEEEEETEEDEERRRRR